MKRENSSHLSPEAVARLQELAGLPDEAIDTSDAPEVRDWTGAKRGLFYAHPSSGDQVAVGLRAGIVEWFSNHTEAGEDLESNINRVLSEHIAEQVKKAS